MRPDRSAHLVLAAPPASGDSASPSPIMEGTRMQGLSPGTDSKVKAATYADAVEGGNEAGAKSSK
jgi:hypothetical protein